VAADAPGRTSVGAAAVDGRGFEARPGVLLDLLVVGADASDSVVVAAAGVLRAGAAGAVATVVAAWLEVGVDDSSEPQPPARVAPARARATQDRLVRITA
jgi:hypothetical protein